MISIRALAPLVVVFVTAGASAPVSDARPDAPVQMDYFAATIKVGYTFEVGYDESAECSQRGDYAKYFAVEARGIAIGRTFVVGPSVSTFLTLTEQILGGGGSAVTSVERPVLSRAGCKTYTPERCPNGESSETSASAGFVRGGISLDWPDARRQLEVDLRGARKGWETCLLEHHYHWAEGGRVPKQPLHFRLATSRLFGRQIRDASSVVFRCSAGEAHDVAGSRSPEHVYESEAHVDITLTRIKAKNLNAARARLRSMRGKPFDLDFVNWVIDDGLFGGKRSQCLLPD